MKKLLLMAAMLLNTFVLLGQEITITNGTNLPITFTGSGDPITVQFTIDLTIPAKYGYTSGTIYLETGTKPTTDGDPPTSVSDRAVLPITFSTSTSNQLISNTINATFLVSDAGDDKEVVAIFCPGTGTTGCVYSEAIDIVKETTDPVITGGGGGGGGTPNYQSYLYKISSYQCPIPPNGGVPALINGSDDNINDYLGSYENCNGVELFPSYSWYSSTDGVNWTKLPQTTQFFQPDRITTTTYYKRGTQQKKCGTQWVRFAFTLIPVILLGYEENDGGIIFSNILKVNVGLAPDVNVCQGAAFTITAAGANSFNWYNVGSSTVIQTGPTLSVNGLSQSGYFTVVGSTSGCHPVTQNVLVNVRPTNSPAPIITGPNALCSNQAYHTYSLVNNDPTLTYQWTIAGTVASFASLNTGNSVTLGIAQITGTSSFTLSAKAINPCGSSVAGSMTVTVDGSIPGTAATPTGPTSVINSAAPTSYSLSTMANAVYTITPSNAVTSSTTNQYGQITIDWNDSFTGQASITAKLQNGCGQGSSSTPLTVQVNNAPSVPAVSGPSSVCNNGTLYWYLSNTSSPNVEFEILPSIAVRASTYNVYAYGNDAVSWSSAYTGQVTMRVRVNGGAWSPIKYVTVNSCPLRLAVDQPDLSSSEIFNVSLYPNPAENSAVLEISNNTVSFATVEILSSSGEVVFKNDQVSTDSPLRIGDNLSPGFYIIKVIAGGNQKVLKFVKNK